MADHEANDTQSEVARILSILTIEDIRKRGIECLKTTNQEQYDKAKESFQDTYFTKKAGSSLK